MNDRQRLEAIVSVVCKYLPPDGISINEAMIEIISLVDPLPPAPAQRKYRRGDRLICLETEDYCIIHISGTDRQWVKFPDTKIGVYTNEQLAELFELLPKEIEQEQPAPAQPMTPEQPTECRNGCPQLQVCDYCQGDGGQDREDAHGITKGGAA
jgi:hypothetical protein